MNFFKYNGCKKTAGVLFKHPINKKFQAVFKYDLFHFREGKEVSYNFSMTNKLSLLNILTPVPVILNVSGLVYSQQKSKGRCDLRVNFRAKLKEVVAFNDGFYSLRCFYSLMQNCLSLCMRAVIL